MRDLLATSQHQPEQKGGKVRRLTSVEEDKLDEYTETLLKIFDANKDGKLQLSEMSR